jgi:molecular chaperone DnaJ
MMPDYYAVLEIPRDADAETIKRAYKRLARAHHPDANPGDEHAEERFKQINEAYAVLSDPGRRQRYDTTGNPDGMGGGDPFAGGFGDLGSIFESFFGGGGGFGGQTRRGHPGDGRDLAVDLRIDLKDAVFGAEREITADTLDRCKRCLGEGAEPGTYRGRCTTCAGTGQLRQQRQTMLGTVVTQRVCPSCQGAGEAPTSPCSDCGGDGRTPDTREVRIEIPAGVDDGATLRVKGRGEPGVRGGRDGDLFVRLHVAPHDVFERRGADLICELRIPVTQAVLGAEVAVDTLDGETTLSIPAGTSDGTILRMSGQGAAELQSRRRGDLLVVVRVDIPKKLSEEERALFEKIADLRGEAHSEAKGLFARLRDSLRG